MSFDPVSDSTPATVVTEIDEDSAFTEAHDSLRVLLSHWKRQNFEMNASGPVREYGAAGTTVPCLVATAGEGMQVEDDIGDLDETQVQETGSKRLKEGNTAKDQLDQLRKDAQVRDQRLAERMAERDAAAAAALANTNAEMMAKLDSLMKDMSASVDVKIQHLSDTMDGKMATLEQKVQERWKTFEDKWSEKAVHPDDKEAVVCNAEFRIRRAVQQDEDERWQKRMADEDKITLNAIETLRSDFNKNER